jgi:hypothetical protein
LASFWRVAAGSELVVGRALAVAWELDEPGLAAMLLAPFRVEALAAADASALARIAARYGEAWTRERVEGWFGRDWITRSSLFNKEVPNWIASLPGMCASLHEIPEAGVLVGRLLAAGVWSELHGWAAGLTGYESAGFRRTNLEELGPYIAGVLTGAANLGDADLRDAVVRFLCQEDEDDLIPCAMSTLRAAQTDPATNPSTTGLDTVASHTARRLEQRLARPTRAAGDWSIKLPKGCACELCAALGGFLVDPARRSFEWPLAKERRSHVHSRIDRAELPVEHQTRRSGRPYTLVLRKTDALFTREREARRHDQDDLDWLTRTVLDRRPGRRRP